MSVTTATPRAAARAGAPSTRRADRRQNAASAALTAALGDSGCIVVSATVVPVADATGNAVATACEVDFYDARSLWRALDVMTSAARATGEPQLAARAGQRGEGAWRVTAGPQTWYGEDGDPAQAAARSHTAWRLTVPGDDLVAVAAALLA
ncbi:hypothetical protein [Kineococcus glutinatus]|uniref:Uncharacterized protein n=1 Tax=Kineococcus glutinatus TaxID=1070872 RepID=A0ABP9HEZ0_9ACTN